MWNPIGDSVQWQRTHSPWMRHELKTSLGLSVLSLLTFIGIVLEFALRSPLETFAVLIVASIASIIVAVNAVLFAGRALRGGTRARLKAHLLLWLNGLLIAGMLAVWLRVLWVLAHFRFPFK